MGVLLFMCVCGGEVMREHCSKPQEVKRKRGGGNSVLISRLIRSSLKILFSESLKVVYSLLLEWNFDIYYRKLVMTS